MAKNKLAKHNHFRNCVLALGSFITVFILGTTLIAPVFDRRFDVFNIYSQNKEFQSIGDNPEDNTTAAYLFQGSGIAGSFIRKVPNFDHFYNVLKKYSSWQLEGWNPQTQQWVSKWNDENLNSWLTVDKVRSDDNFNEKVSLTVKNNAPIATKFRFTFGIDLRVKEFVNRTGKYEYTLTYQANQTQNYNMRFNWSDLIPLVQAGTISLNHGIKNVGGKNVFWFRITGNQNLAAGQSFTVDPTYGLIADAVTNSWEYDGQEGRYPDMIRLGTSEYYAIVSTGDTGTEKDGYIRTIRVWNNNGTIKTSLVDSLEYDRFDGIAPSICLVSGDIYAISYYNDTGNKQTIKTVSIDDADGMIAAAVTDTQQLTYDSIAASRSQIIHMSGDLFAVTYSASDSDLWLETINITAAGDISAVVANSREINTTDGIYPDFCFVDSDTVAVVYTGGGSDGYLSTWNITSTGVITSTRASEWEFDTAKGGTPTIAKVTGNIFMVAYEDTNADLFVKTVQINDTGSIWKVWKDTQAIDTTNGDYPTFFNVSVNSIANKWIKGITFSGEGSDGYVSTFDVTSAGVIGSEIDTLEFDTADSIWYAPTCFVSGFYFLTVYEGTDNDGWAKTFKIYVNDPPVLSDESPVTGSTGVSATPTLSVNVSDVGDYWVNSTLYSNSSGSWVKFGSPNSTRGYGAISNSVISTYEYNKRNGKQPDVIKLSSDATFSYFAIVNNGTDSDGFINTTKVWNSNGTIYPGNVDSYEYDTTNTQNPHIRNVYGNIYVISYWDTDGYCKIITVSITSAGDIDTITGIIDTLLTTHPSTGATGGYNIIEYLGNNIYVIAYSNKSTWLWLETCFIDSSGNIGATINDSVRITGDGFPNYPQLCNIDSDTIVVAFSDSSSFDGFISTWNISSTGDITATRADTWEFDASQGNYPDIIKISGNIFSIAYGGLSSFCVKTCTIDDAGKITKSWIDTNDFAVLVSGGRFAHFSPIDNNLYIVTYSGGSGSDGYVSTIKITDAGDIGFECDYLEFDTEDSISYAPILPVANDYYLIVYEGTDSDGWSCTVKIENSTNTTIRQTNSNFSAASTKYWWSVNTTDGVSWTNETYSFTTAGGGEPQTAWHVLDQSINGSIFNQSQSNQISTWNGSIYNTSSFYAISDWNGTIFNSSSFNPISDWNGSLYNQSLWHQTSQWNGTIYNISIGYTIIQTWNGTIYNQSIWHQLVLWNGTIFNTSTFELVNNWNGSIYNTTGAMLIQEWNGSLFNQSNYHLIQEYNGTIYNISIGFVLIQNWNGTVYNQSSWQDIEWNGSIWNQSTWNLIEEWQGSIYNQTAYNKIVNWNGSIFNQSQSNQISTWNGSIYNTSVFKLINNWNGTIYNQSQSHIINLWNGTIFNISGVIQIQEWNGSIYNISVGWQTIQEFNGSIYNQSNWNIINNWNGSIYNLTSSYIINDWNGSIYNITSSCIVNNWNGTIYNQTINNITLSNPIPSNTIVRLRINTTYVSGHTADILISITRNHTHGLLMNTTLWFNNTYLFTNNSWGNGTISFYLFDYWIGILHSNNIYNWTVNCSTNVEYVNETYSFTPRIVKTGFMFLKERDLILSIAIGATLSVVLGLVWRRRRKKQND